MHSHAACVFFGSGAVADEWQLLLQLRFWFCFRKCADILAFGEALGHYSDLRPIICRVLWVHRQPSVIPPAAITTVTIAVHTCFPVTAHQKRGHAVWRTRRGDKKGFTTLSSSVGPKVILTPNVSGECSPVCLIKEGVDQWVDPGWDVTHPNKDVEEVLKQRLVAGVVAQDEGDVGDEEGAPHDEEKEEDDTQDLREGSKQYKITQIDDKSKGK